METHVANDDVDHINDDDDSVIALYNANWL